MFAGVLSGVPDHIPQCSRFHLTDEREVRGIFIEQKNDESYISCKIEGYFPMECEYRERNICVSSKKA